ncbi:hypothetical protein D9M69_484130 [compost metagenome]
MRFEGELQIAGAKVPQVAHVTGEARLQRHRIRVDLQVKAHQVEAGLHLHAGEVLDAAEGEIET